MLTLVEHSEIEVASAAPTLAARQALARELGDRLTLDWLAGGVLRVRSSSWVGMVRLPGGPSIRVVPKLAGDELDVVRMLTLAAGSTPVEIRALERDLGAAPDGGLPELLCRLVVQTSYRILHAGPLRDYRTQHDDLGLLRGRLDLRRQAFHHFGRVDVLACEYQELDHDVLDNRVLRAALAAVLRVTGSAALRQQAARLHEDFEVLAPGPCPDPADLERMLVYDRRNTHYRAAHAWALVLLRAAGIASLFEDDGAPAHVVLIDMNALFEAFVTWLLQQVGGLDVTPQRRDRSVLTSQGKPWGTVIPDILVRSGVRTLPVDAKYKRYVQHKVTSGDVYQLFLYAHAYSNGNRRPAAVLIYPSDEPTAELRIDVAQGRHGTAAVHCIGIPLRQLVDDLAVTSPAQSRYAQSLVGSLRLLIEVATSVFPVP